MRAARRGEQHADRLGPAAADGDHDGQGVRGHGGGLLEDRPDLGREVGARRGQRAARRVPLLGQPDVRGVDLAPQGVHLLLGRAAQGRPEDRLQAAVDAVLDGGELLVGDVHQPGEARVGAVLRWKSTGTPRARTGR